MMKTYRKSFSLFIFALLFLTLLNHANAQQQSTQSFVQSRFVGTDVDCPRNECDGERDGVLHFRLKQVGELGEEVFDDADGDKAVRFEVQFRAAIRDMTYNTGEVFITSIGTQAFSQDLASDCKISSEGVFNNNPNYSVGSPQHVAPDLMKVSVSTTPNVVLNELVELRTAYRTYAQLECKIADTNADAGLALHARTYMANSIWTDLSGTPTPKVAFAVADNDLRGFRLDGKTWAEDYLLSSNADFIVKFSKGIETQLTTRHFVLSYTDGPVLLTADSVVHSPGDDEVFISYTRSAADATLSISDTAVIFDNDGNGLAPGSFIASLIPSPGLHISEFSRENSAQTVEYEARGLDVWCVDWFGPNIIASTLNKDNLCLADEFSYDCLDRSDGQPFIDSVFGDPDDPRNICSTGFTLVVDPTTVRRNEQRDLDLRFKRNAVLVNEQRDLPTNPNVVLVTRLQAFTERVSTFVGDQIILRDNIAPKITVRPMSLRVPANQGEDTLDFTVTADEPVNNSTDTASYRLLRIREDGSKAVDESASILVRPTADDLTVEVVAVTFAASGTFGYTLGYVAGGISDRGTNSPVNVAGEPLKDGDAFDSSRLAIARVRALGCSSFYPHIGQQELFIELSDSETFVANRQGFVIDGERVPARRIEPVADTTEDSVEGQLSVFKVTFDEIVSTAPITVEYHRTNETIGTTATATARCIFSLTNDSDGDGTPDITDIDPFDEGEADINTAVAQEMPLASAPAESSDWYSRDTVIRGLMRGESLTYKDEGMDITTPTISAAGYFGIESANAKVFRVSSDCQNVLDAAVANNLNKVKLDEFCTDVSNNFGSEFAGSSDYAWVTINNEGYLASDYRIYSDVRVLPELSLSGQSSYLYASPTTQSITISLEVSDTNMLPELQVTTRADGLPSTSVLVSLVVDSEDVSRAEGEYHLTRDGMHPAVGQTITHSFSAPSVWSFMSDNIAPTAGGHLLSSFDYSMYAHDQVDVRLAAADEQPIYLHRILLYDVEDEDNPELVASVESGKKYTIVADFTTATNTSATISPMQVGYEEDELIAVARNSDFVGGESESFTFTVEATEGAITVGWDSIGDVEDVKARYLVAEMKNVVEDSDGDRIPNSIDSSLRNDNEQLLVAGDIGGVLTAGDDNSKLFISDAGLIIALGQGGDDADHYSVANIDYDQLNDDTKDALGLTETGFTTDNPIETLATFGIRDVAYAIGEDGKTAVGGVTHITFPVETVHVGKILYLNKYDSRTQQWKAFERDNTAEGFSDTWYAIARPDDNEPCPTDITTYRKGHKAAGERHMGFVASAQNCIMVVITDGGPYDNGGLDSRVVDPLEIGLELAGSSDGGDGGQNVRGGGGGGAIGVGTLLLLLALLLSLIATTRNQSRFSRYKRQA